MSHEMPRIVEPVDTGLAELVPDQHGGWTLLLDGVEQSSVSLDEPRRLGFSYLRHLAAVLDSTAHRHTPQRILHLGGGALSLPRYVAAVRPSAIQVVVEHDRALVALVTRVLPLPADADITIRIDDARTFIESTMATFDAVVVDVYQGARMPPSVSSVAFAQQVARVLDPRGVLAVNVTDLPPLIGSRVQAATLKAVFADVALVTEAAMLRGRRYGNVVLLASPRAGRLPVTTLDRLVNVGAPRTRVVHGAELAHFIGGTGPRVEGPEDRQQ
jgi:spermidine synthase